MEPKLTLKASCLMGEVLAEHDYIKKAYRHVRKRGKF